MTNTNGADVFDRPEIFLTLGLALIKQNKGAAVEDLIADTLSRHPGDPLYEHIAQMIRTSKVPVWHAAMLHDNRRNAAYRMALAAAAPGKVVLDIGTGSGLLAMIAARAGAERVVACEANPVVAEAARRIVAANGLDHIITVHACHSSKLERSAIADAGADLVVSEIFAADLVSEGVLAALAHARAELAAPGAQFLPEAACLRVALAECTTLRQAPKIVEGFDLGQFESLYRQRGFAENKGRDIILRSDVADLARLDWTASEPVPVTGLACTEVIATGGTANVVLQWLKIEFGNGIIYENPPGAGEAEHWEPILWKLRESIATRSGEHHAINAFHHLDALAVWAGASHR